MATQDGLWSNEGKRIGSISFTLSGAVLGSAAGSIIGTFIPLPGISTLIGASLGGAVGGLCVGVSGMFLGSQIGDLLYQKKVVVPSILNFD
jgi:uncharacterized protein YqgC (DUF456 family)